MDREGMEPGCRRVVDMLHVLGEADPSPEHIEEIAGHFAECARCMDAEAALEQVMAIYRREAGTPVSPDLERRLLQCVGALDQTT
jgi:hypothetical protein